MTPPPAHSSHTERVTEAPLELVYDGDAEHCRPALIKGKYLQITVSRAEDFGHPKLDAELIVKAVNLHDKLVEALEADHKLIACGDKCETCALLREARRGEK
jgi:hypothetical protein